MLRIGPAGNSESFYAAGKKHTNEAPEWLNAMGLNAFEYSFGRGVNITDAGAEKIRIEAEKYDVEFSVHAPYYTNLANPDAEMVEKTFGYIEKSIEAVIKLGGRRVVFHPASCGKATREDALNETKKNLERLMARLEETMSCDYILCVETMGKKMQIGTVDEVLEFCKPYKRLYPCFDFGHINSYTQGGLKTSDDFRRIIDRTADMLGDKKTRNMHVHFSKIMYGAAGEIKHLTFADEKYGPEFAPLAAIIDEYRLTPTIICESSGTMAEDALTMKSCLKFVY